MPFGKYQNTVMLRNVSIAVSFLFTPLMLPGCAFYYFDHETNSQHLIGFGHMVSRVHTQKDNSSVAMYGVTTIGVGIGEFGHNSGISAGLQSQRQLIFSKQGSIVKICRLEDSFFSFPIVAINPRPAKSPDLQELLTTCYE